MDIASLFALLPPWLQGVSLTVLTMSWLAGQYCSATATPPPNTGWGRVYAILEVVGGIWGRAKEIGIPAPTWQDAVQRLTAAVASGQPITAAMLPAALGIAAQVPPPPRPVAAPSPAVVGAMLLAIVFGGCLSACALFGGQPWSPAQTAYVELAIGAAAEDTAAAVITTPGLSAADIADIQAGAAGVDGGVAAAAASLTGVGSAGQQAISAAVSAVTRVAGNLGAVLTAKRGASVDPDVALLTAGEQALQQLPGVIAAVVQVNGGWQPSADDIAKATAELHQAAARVAAYRSP